MKLLRHSTDGIVLQLSTREKTFLERLLSFYPIEPEPKPALTRDGNSRLAEATALLHESLREQKKELGSWLALCLREGGALSRTDAGWRLVLERTDADRLLQVLNELRIGAWNRLGCPEDPGASALAKTASTAPLHSIMTLAGQFEIVLLHALDARPGTTSPGRE